MFVDIIIIVYLVKKYHVSLFTINYKQMKQASLFIIVFILLSVAAIAQSFPKHQIKTKFKATRIDMVACNSDGVFKAREMKIHKWGMFQWIYSGTEVKMMIPQEYDSGRYFLVNAAFTAIYNSGKVGIYHL